MRCMAVLLLAGLLSGCTSATMDDDVAPSHGNEARSTDPPAVADAWTAGQWFAYDVRTEYGLTGTVTAVAGNETGHFLAGERDWSLQEATSDLPILGHIDASTGRTTAFGADWDLLQLPVEANETWIVKVRLPTGVGEPADTELWVSGRWSTLPEAAQGAGDESGWLVEALDASGAMRVRAGYSPRLGVVTSLEIFGDFAEPVWRAQIEATGPAWGKSAWSATAAVLVAEYTLVAPNVEAPASPYVDPAWADSFQPSSGADAVFGYLIAYTFGGMQTLSVTEPDGKAHPAVAAGVDSLNVTVIDLPSQPGDWTASSAGAGFVAFGGIYLWEVHIKELQP
jgi:hypothetical protein